MIEGELVRRFLMVVVSGLLLAGSAAVAPTTGAQAAPALPGPYASTWWTGNVLHVVYSSMGPFTEGSDESVVRVLVDGKVVDDPNVPPRYEGPTPPGPAEKGAFVNRAISVPRDAETGPARVQVVSDASIDRGWQGGETVRTVYYDQTVWQRSVTPVAGDVAITSLLDGLKVKKELRKPGFKAVKFGSPIDADRDGEATRDELLRITSSQPVTIKKHVVRTGDWYSDDDQRTLTVASKVVVDHVVPSKEAWASGAASWSPRKRIAYANDVDHAQGWMVVSQDVHRARAERAPTAWIPSNATWICPYLMSWITVKSRWGLTVDAAEKALLVRDVDAYCAYPYTPAPPRPNIARLGGSPTRSR